MNGSERFPESFQELFNDCIPASLPQGWDEVGVFIFNPIVIGFQFGMILMDQIFDIMD